MQINFLQSGASRVIHPRIYSYKIHSIPNQKRMWSMSLVEDIELECPSAQQQYIPTPTKTPEQLETGRRCLKRSKRVVDLVSLEDSCAAAENFNENHKERESDEEEENCGGNRNRSGDLGAFGNFGKLRRILDAELDYFHRDAEISVAASRTGFQGNFEVFKHF